MNLAFAQNVGVGTSNPETTLHVKAPDNPTIKMQADGSSEESGRLSLRRENETGIDMYYDGSKAEGLLIFESYSAGVSTGKILTINESTKKIKLEVAEPITTPSENLVIAADGTIGTKAEFQIGDAAFGGVIFWLDETGEHGLVVGFDEFTGPWTDNFSANASFAKSNGIRGGILNTTLIIIAAGGNQNAGSICSAYQGGSFGDWYLPSEYEFVKLIDPLYFTDVNDAILSGAGTPLGNGENYWTSGEITSQSANVIEVPDANTTTMDKANSSIRIRPIRAF